MRRGWRRWLEGRGEGRGAGDGGGVAQGGYEVRGTRCEGGVGQRASGGARKANTEILRVAQNDGKGWCAGGGRCEGRGAGCEGTGRITSHPSGAWTGHPGVGRGAWFKVRDTRGGALVAEGLEEAFEGGAVVAGGWEQGWAGQTAEVAVEVAGVGEQAGGGFGEAGGREEAGLLLAGEGLVVIFPCGKDLVGGLGGAGGEGRCDAGGAGAEGVEQGGG
jgi:hypothetical protein